MKQEVLKKGNEVFKDIFEDDELVISEETNSSDIEGWDSLTHITLMASIEDEFNIKFTMKEILDMQNVGDLVTSIVEKTK